MKAILTFGRGIFVRDDKNSDKYIERYVYESFPYKMEIKIDWTLHPEYYELFLQEGESRWRDRIYATSSFDKLKSFLEDICNETR